MATSSLDFLRPKPFRGAVVAAGVVVLVTLVWTVAARFLETWAPGVHLAYALVAWVFVMAMALLSSPEGDGPRAYQSVLYVASFALLILVVFFVGPVLEPDIAFWSAGHLTWMTVVLAGYALAFAILRDSAVCTLIGALTGGVAVLAAASWIGLVASPEAVRRILLGLMLVYAIAAVGQRDRRLRHGVALIDAAGLASLVIAAIPVATSILVGLIAEGPVDEQDRVSVGVGWGWELLLVATGFGLIAYSSVDRQPGPAYLGVLNLVAFAGWTASGHTTLLGWPIVLALAAAALLAIGLRPTVPAPPAPDVDVPEPPPLPWR